MIYARIIVFLLLILSAVFAPLVFTLGFFVLAASFFPKFWETVAVGVFLDSLYFSPVIFSNLRLGFFTVNFIVVLAVVEVLKNFVQGKNILARLVVTVPGVLYIYSLLFFLY